MLKLHIVLRPRAQDSHPSERPANQSAHPAGHALFSIPHQGNMTLLETLELHRQPVESQCRAGFCGACRTRLYQGQVRYLTTPLAFIGEDEILPCCCVPQTDLHIGLYADDESTADSELPATELSTLSVHG